MSLERTNSGHWDRSLDPPRTPDPGSGPRCEARGRRGHPVQASVWSVTEVRGRAIVRETQAAGAWSRLQHVPLGHTLVDMQSPDVTQET